MSNDLDRARKYLYDEAQRRHLSIADSPELTSNTFRGGDAGNDELRVDQLPTAKLGLTIDGIPLLLGELPSAPDVDAVLDCLRRFRNQCVVARSHLSQNHAIDLNLFMIGPSGSDTEPDWEPLAFSVERDDRVARKLVWLRPTSPAEDELSFANFLRRTFLARPWSGAMRVDTAEPDRLTYSLKEIASSQVPVDVLERWVEIVNADAEAGADLVDQLIEAWKETYSVGRIP